MSLKEEYQFLVESMNKKLAEDYGYFADGIPMYRIAWSEDQYEWREANVWKFDNNGNKIGEVTGIQYLPKYKQWLPNMWVLERCCDTTNELNNKELTEKYSYEPAFPFAGPIGPLPPDWDICVIVISSINAHLGKEVKVYKDPDLDPAAKSIRLKELQKELFGNETDIGDALSHKEGVGYTTSKDMRVN